MADKPRIAVLTSGGDAPGMNASIRSAIRATISHGGEAFGIERGYEGLLEPAFVALDLGAVGGVLDRGGTFLGTARSERMFTDEGLDLAAAHLAEQGITGLVVIGGDGSFRGARELIARGAKVVGVPATIDNDVSGTDTSIGFDTALNTVCEAVSKVRDTASSHERSFVIEAMGRHSGLIALYAGLAAGADFILVPEVEWHIEDVCKAIAQGVRRGKVHSIILVAEGAAHGMTLAAELSQLCGHEVRAVVLGHVQRGGAPSAFDRILASRMGARAVQALIDGENDVMVGLRNARMELCSLEEAVAKPQTFNRELFELAKVLAL